MRVRPYKDQDIPEMIAIWNEIVKDGVAFPQEELLDETTGRRFFAEQSHCGVSENDNGDIVGLYILHPNNIGRCGHICNASYAVAKKSRGMGVGEKLVKDSLAEGARLEFKIMQFNAVAMDNERAHKLYRRLGFLPLGIIEGGFRKKNGQMMDIQLYWRKL